MSARCTRLTRARPAGARDLYTRRRGTVDLVCHQRHHGLDPNDKDDVRPADSKVYRHPTFYEVPDEVGHM
jgi:ring-1,2-phenylacetyl-CoA epoxidase subunit PaaB